MTWIEVIVTAAIGGFAAAVFVLLVAVVAAAIAVARLRARFPALLAGDHGRAQQ